MNVGPANVDPVNVGLVNVARGANDGVGRRENVAPAALVAPGSASPIVFLVAPNVGGCGGVGAEFVRRGRSLVVEGEGVGRFGSGWVVGWAWVGRRRRNPMRWSVASACLRDKHKVN